MKNKYTNRLGKFLLKLTPLKVCIIDDTKAYFNEQMLLTASASGEYCFEREFKCNSIILNDLLKYPRDIVIIDIKGTTTEDIGKDGFDVAKVLLQKTSSFIVTTSAHKFHLKNRDQYGDYVITDRLLTAIDFIEELETISSIYLKRKIKFYQKITFKVGKY